MHVRRRRDAEAFDIFNNQHLCIIEDIAWRLGLCRFQKSQERASIRSVVSRRLGVAI